MTLDIFKLTFTTPLHLSLGKLETYERSDDVLHSDTLKSALFVTAMQLYGEELDNEQFFDSFQVSSAFPFAEGAYFFPKPFSFIVDGQADFRKQMKKIRYVRQDFFERMLVGEKHIDEQALLAASDPEIWKKDNTQRVLIDRIDARGVPFYLEKLYAYRPETRGLYFIVRCPEGIEKEGFLKRLEAVTALLGANGIGLQKSVGNGCFKVERGQIDFHLPAATEYNASVCLSLFYPASPNDLSEKIIENSFYDFQQRGGWIASPAFDDHLRIYKKSIYMFKEGSVFYFPQNPLTLSVRGIKVDVRPVPLKREFPPVSHPVWREGNGIFLPIKI